MLGLKLIHVNKGGQKVIKKYIEGNMYDVSVSTVIADGLHQATGCNSSYQCYQSKFDTSHFCVNHSRLIPMYNARFILWPPSLSSPIRIWEENDDGHVE